MMRMRSSQGRVSLSALILCFRAEKMILPIRILSAAWDRNVEKKNREQRLKNPVHRAPLSIVRGSQPQTKNQRANRVRPAIRDQRLMESMIQATLVAAKIGLIEDGGQGEKKYRLESFLAFSTAFG